MSDRVVVMLVEPGVAQAVAAKFVVGEDGGVVKSGVVRVGGDPMLVLLTSVGWVIALALPGLEVVWETQVGLSPFAAEHIHDSYISPTGEVVLRTAEYEFKLCTIVRDANGPPRTEPRIYDYTKATMWARSIGASLNKANVDADLDLLFMPQGVDAVADDSSEHGRRSISGGGGGGGGGGDPSNPFEKTKQQLQERTDRLENLDRKFGDLDNAAQQFADKIREYNERQAQKKWWQL
ncbi:hypothetical protein HK104_004868 [Borealophlyctis nickersoniae]|nr:hypothetical protein HK104_004868 [Borealophlyctis nickersoniae]